MPPARALGRGDARDHPCDLSGAAVAAPQRLARLHGSLAVGERVALVGTGAWDRRRLVDVVTGAGFSTPRGGAARRVRTLPDFVGPGMRLLVCGLNPSLYAADAGVGFARPGNRFWPAALRAGVVGRDRDPWHALEHHGVGLTDLVKRATVSAAEIRPAEFATGLARVTRMVAWLQPGAVCFVGLTGWRLATGDRRAGAGPLAAPIGGRPAYLMPNPSGLNASARVGDLAAHLAAAAALGSAHL